MSQIHSFTILGLLLLQGRKPQFRSMITPRHGRRLSCWSNSRRSAMFHSRSNRPEKSRMSASPPGSFPEVCLSRPIYLQASQLLFVLPSRELTLTRLIRHTKRSLVLQTSIIRITRATNISPLARGLLLGSPLNSARYCVKNNEVQAYLAKSDAIQSFHHSQVDIPRVPDLHLHGRRSCA